MVVVVARGDERRLVTHPLLQLEPEHVAPEAERAVDVRHLEVHVTDVDAGIDAAHAGSLLSPDPASHQMQYASQGIP